MRFHYFGPIYPTLMDFYGVRGGQESPQLNFGVFNFLEDPAGHFDGLPASMWAVNVVADTGDVYAAHPFAPQVILLGKCTVHRFLDGEAVITQQEVFYPELGLDVEQRFTGWAYGEAGGQSLAWFAERLDPVEPVDPPTDGGCSYE